MEDLKVGGIVPLSSGAKPDTNTDKITSFYEEQTIKDRAFFQSLDSKPPIGLKPKLIHELERTEKRLNNLSDAISQYINVTAEIPIEWVKEYNEISTINHEKWGGTIGILANRMVNISDEIISIVENGKEVNDGLVKEYNNIVTKLSIMSNDLKIKKMSTSTE